MLIGQANLQLPRFEPATPQGAFEMHLIRSMSDEQPTADQKVRPMEVHSPTSAHASQTHLCQ